MSAYVISNGTFYAIPARSNELYHYGVKGMKWGVHKNRQQAHGAISNHYAAKANKHISKIATSKTQLGKNYHNYRAYRNEVKAGGHKNYSKLGSEGLLKTIDSVYGHGRYSRLQSAASKYYDRKGDYARTNLGGAMAKASAYNLKTASEANARLHNSKKLSEYASNYVNAVANRPIKTWSGRTTTTGRRMVDAMLTGGYVGLAMDVGHYAKKKSAAKKDYKSSVNKAQDKYDSTINKIEKDYKRGQQLSDADYAREQAADRKFNEETKKAKETYKKAMRS